MTFARWCFLLKNFKEEDVLAFTKLDVRYVCMAKCIGVSGTPQLEGFVNFRNGMRIAAVRKISPLASWNPFRGVSSDIRESLKDKGEFFEFGSLERAQRAYGDQLLACIEMLKDGKSLHDVAVAYPVAFVKFHEGIQDFKSILDKK